MPNEKETQPGSPHFEPADIEIMERAMDLIPNLTLVTYIASRVRKKARYPITGPADFLAVADGKHGALKFRDTALTLEVAEKFLSREFFPIEDEQALLTRLLVAFQRGDLTHAEEQREERETHSREVVKGRPVTTLPQPAWKPAKH